MNEKKRKTRILRIKRAELQCATGKMNLLQCTLLVTCIARIFQTAQKHFEIKNNRC